MTGHIPVLFEECMQALRPERGGLIMDGTLGGAGHSEGLLSRGPIELIGVDKDAAAIERCKARLAAYGDRVRFVKDDFKNVKQILESLGETGIDGALIDLGVSSFQLDEADRGFSYSADAPLDMRMDRDAELSAYDVINEYEPGRLKRLLYEYGEEKFAPAIVSAIMKARPVKSTGELAEIIKQAIPAAARRTGGNPAKRTFQAVRIEVNSELEGLGNAINDFLDVLRPQGRLAVISFHSLEDRAVKQAFKKAEDPCTCPPDFPVCVCGKKPLGRIVTKKPLLPGEQEMQDNNRAHSAKLRVFERSAE